MLNKEIKEILSKIEDIGWTYYCGEEDNLETANEIDIDLRKSSPAGEDFGFSFWFDGTVENFIQEIKNYSENFDREEHIKMWVESSTSGVPDIETLVEDAKDIEDMLEELVDFIENGCELVEHKYDFSTVNDVQCYIEENYNLSGGTAHRLVNNILVKASEIEDENEQYNFLSEMLDGFGMSDKEIRQITL